MWQQLAQTTLLSEPGTNWLDSDFGFGILGTVLADLVQPGQPGSALSGRPAVAGARPFLMPYTAIEVTGELIWRPVTQ